MYPNRAGVDAPFVVAPFVDAPFVDAPLVVAPFVDAPLDGAEPGGRGSRTGVCDTGKVTAPPSGLGARQTMR
jgi:hypothetical protein